MKQIYAKSFPLHRGFRGFGIKVGRPRVDIADVTTRFVPGIRSTS